MNDGFETGKAATVAQTGEAPDLESVMHLIWDRLDAHDRDRRRQRRNAAGLATVILAVAVLWTGFPTKPTGGPVLLRDGDGHIRARFDVDAESGRTTLQLVDASGTPQAVLGTDIAGPMLTFYDKQGGARMRFGLEDGSEAPIIDVVDQPTGAQSRVDLVSLREARTLPLSPKDPTVRQASNRGSRSSRVVRYYRTNPDCKPGTLGCARYSRVEGSPPGEG